MGTAFAGEVFLGSVGISFLATFRAGMGLGIFLATGDVGFLAFVTTDEAARIAERIIFWLRIAVNFFLGKAECVCVCAK